MRIDEILEELSVLLQLQMNALSKGYGLRPNQTKEYAERQERINELFRLLKELNG